MSQERAYKNCLEMLQQRGYDIVDEDPENMRITVVKHDGNQMMVFFNQAPKFDAKSLKEIISMMAEMEITHSLVVYKTTVTPATKNTLLSQTSEMRIELFAEEDLQYNITKHRLQPKFEKLGEKQSEEIKKKFGTKFGILRLDRPISRFYDYKNGDVIKITRSNGYINFRIVKG